MRLKLGKKLGAYLPNSSKKNLIKVELKGIWQKRGWDHTI